MSEEKKSVFETLNSVNVNDFTEQKNNLTYLTWSKAWEAVKSRFPSAKYKVIKDMTTGLPYYHDPEVGYMVMTEVTIEEDTIEMWLPVMDYRNKAMLQPTMTDVNKSIMRCLAKNIAMFGLGLYIYAGQDLPTEEDATDAKEAVLERQDIAKTKVVENQPISAAKIKILTDKCKADNINIGDFLALYKVGGFDELNEKKFLNINQNWEQIKTMCGAK